MFIDSYLRICELCGKSPTTVLKELRISNSVYDNWKKGAEPLNPTKLKIANYFNITIDELMSGSVSTQKKPLTENEELNRYLDELRNRPEMRMLFSVSEGCTKEEVEQAVKIIEALRK